jgi:hypothetical protein
VGGEPRVEPGIWCPEIWAQVDLNESISHNYNNLNIKSEEK